MADLEEMGYIIQPHTSAGRIPSDKGYRLYVDMLMEEKKSRNSWDRGGTLRKQIRWISFLKQAEAKGLATNTNYATMVSTPMNNSKRLSSSSLSMVDENSVIAVIVLGGNVIKNKIIETLMKPISNENLLKAEYASETPLNGMSIEEINLGLIARLKEQAGIHSQVVGYVLDAVADAIHVDDDMQIYKRCDEHFQISGADGDNQERTGKSSVHLKKNSSYPNWLHRPWHRMRIPAFRYISEMRPGTDYERLQCRNCNLRTG